MEKHRFSVNLEVLRDRLVAELESVCSVLVGSCTWNDVHADSNGEIALKLHEQKDGIAQIGLEEALRGQLDCRFVVDFPLVRP